MTCPQGRACDAAVAAGAVCSVPGSWGDCGMRFKLKHIPSLVPQPPTPLFLSLTVPVRDIVVVSAHAREEWTQKEGARRQPWERKQYRKVQRLEGFCWDSSRPATLHISWCEKITSQYYCSRGMKAQQTHTHMQYICMYNACAIYNVREYVNGLVLG